MEIEKTYTTNLSKAGAAAACFGLTFYVCWD
jgi:hypothetical protein